MKNIKPYSISPKSCSGTSTRKPRESIRKNQITLHNKDQKQYTKISMSNTAVDTSINQSKPGNSSMNLNPHHKEEEKTLGK